ncbi:MAG: hypothetical protein LBJ00_08425 [Planctomycetaceae bacterium]|nr:hypothetical protein [Planctomycetaceae bacterium]
MPNLFFWRMAFLSAMVVMNLGKWYDSRLYVAGCFYLFKRNLNTAKYAVLW